MKNILLMRYRAIAASLFEYVRTRGNVYGKLFSFANSRISPTENGSGSAITELYQIANGIPESVYDTIMYSTLETDDQGIVGSLYPEELLLHFLSGSIGFAAGHSDDILFSKGDYFGGSKELGQAYIQYVEELMMRSLTKSLTIASGHSDDILFGLGKYLSAPGDRGLGQEEYVEDLLLKSLTRSITRGSGYTYDILFGQSVDFIEMDVRGLGRSADAEKAIGKSINRLLHIAGLSIDDILFGQSLGFIEMDDKGLARSADVERAIGKDITRLLYVAGLSSDDILFGRGLESTIFDNLGQGRLADTIRTSSGSISKLLHKAGSSSENILFSNGIGLYKLLHSFASPSDSNLLNGRGLMSSKLVGNSAINLEVPDKTQMFFIEKIDNNVSSGITIDSCQSGGISKTEIVSIAGGCFLYTTEERFIEYLNGTLEELLPEDFGDVTEIPDSTHIIIFNDSTKISRIEFPDTLEIISNNCFRDSTITEVIFSANIKKIGYNSFSFAATNAVFDFSKAKQIPTLSPDDGLYGTFGDNSTITIKVPSNLYDNWINKNGWNSMSDRIVAV